MESLGLMPGQRGDLPVPIEPMLATPGELPGASEDYAYEFKWDGIRAILSVTPTIFRIQTRHGGEATGAFPEIHALQRAVGGRSIVLDGEIVCLDEKGRPRFNRLQHRLHRVGTPPKAWVDSHPASFIAFDLLYDQGQWLFDLPYLERRRRLDGLNLEGPNWITPAYHAGAGPRVLEASRQLGFEGIVAKAKTSPYRPGTRSRSWIKIKNWNRQEFVVGGWTLGEGSRGGAIGSLLLGYYDHSTMSPRLVYAGKVGTGFTAADAEGWLRRLQHVERQSSPFASGAVPKDARFADPRYVVDVTFGEWTPDGILRHPSYQGLRSDKKPEEVELERTEN